MQEFHDLSYLVPAAVIVFLAGAAGYAYGLGDGARSKLEELYQSVHIPLANIRAGLGLEAPKDPKKIMGDQGVSYVKHTLEETLASTAQALEETQNQ